MRGLTFERFPSSRPHSFLKTQLRWRHVQTCGTTRCLGSAVRRQMWRLKALPDRFSHAWSKPTLSQGATNLDVMPIDVPKLTSTSTDRTQRDHLWNDWLDYFSQIESIENERTWLREKLQESIKLENYDEASQTKRDLEALDQRDVLSTIQQELSRAIEDERYDDAARLRDEGLVGLCGWWVVRGHDDPRGQLMYICKEFCRYSGRIFTPNEIAALCGVSESFMTEEFFAEKAETSSGHFAMEVFLRRDRNGSFQHQSCVLRSPEPEALNDDGGGGGQEEEEIGAEVYVKAAENVLREDLRIFVSIVQRDDKDDEDNKEVYLPSQPNEAEDAEVAAVAMNDVSDLDNEAEVYGDRSDDDFAPMELQYRLPADLQWWDRNRFVLSVDEESTLEEEEDDEEEEEEEEEEEDFEDEEAVAVSTADGESFDLEEHLTQALEKAIDDMPMSILKPLLKERISFHSMSKKFYALVKHAIKKLDGEEIDLDDLPAWSKTSQEPDSTELEGEVMFTRLPLEERPATDPFTGIFVGRFGPHGLEILHLSRQIDTINGKECVYVRKITGDANVPAGELSFMARIDRANRTVLDATHSEELGIHAQYSGRGRIAQTGYKKPEWVDGELLVFDPGSPLAGGAEMGLVWSIPHARRAHILLYRLTFPQME